MIKAQVRKMQRKVINILIVIVTAALLICAVLLGRNLYRNAKEAKQFDELSDLFPEVSEPPEIVIQISDAADSETDAAEDTDAGNEETAGSSTPAVKATAKGPSEAEAKAWKEWWNAAAQDRFPVYQSLSETNSDIVGWVRIEGTAIDYPVCHTPYDPEKYLHMDINQVYSGSGTPFIEAACTVEPRSNLLIYGHHMRSGEMFAALKNYTSVSYYNAHPYIQFDTPD